MTDRLEVIMPVEGRNPHVADPPDGRYSAAARTSESISAIVYRLHQAELAVDAMRESIESPHGLRRAEAADIALNTAIRDLRTLATRLEREMALIPVRSSLPTEPACAADFAAVSLPPGRVRAIDPTTT